MRSTHTGKKASAGAAIHELPIPAGNPDGDEDNSQFGEIGLFFLRRYSKIREPGFGRNNRKFFA